MALIAIIVPLFAVLLGLVNGNAQSLDEISKLESSLVLAIKHIFLYMVVKCFAIV